MKGYIFHLRISPDMPSPMLQPESYRSSDSSSPDEWDRFIDVASAIIKRSSSRLIKIVLKPAVGSQQAADAAGEQELHLRLSTSNGAVSIGKEALSTVLRGLAHGKGGKGDKDGLVLAIVEIDAVSHVGLDLVINLHHLGSADVEAMKGASKGAPGTCTAISPWYRPQGCTFFVTDQGRERGSPSCTIVEE
eukprot:gene31800-7000_t